MNSIKGIIIFLGVIIVFLFLANFVIYEALVLSLGSTQFSGLVISILAGTSLSFIASIFLGRKKYNFFTRLYTRLSMMWMGLFGYLFLASVLYVLEYVWIGDASRTVAKILFGAVALVSVYGFFHAQNIKIKNISVKLEKIPEAWRTKKAVFISDLHVGQINGKKYVENVVKKLQDIAPDIIFIGGDLFDGSSIQGILDCIDPFQNLHISLGMHFILGNHEGYGSAPLFIKKIKDVGINVLRDEKIIIDGIQIVGVDYRTTVEQQAFKNVLEHISIDATIPSILLKHEPRHVEVAEQVGISLQLSGHTHKAQQWPYEYFARMTYGRFTYGLQRIKNTQVHTSSGVGTWGPPLRVGTDCEIVVFNFV
jgi:predicted MPP superfamily phosphohydrolase